MGVNVQFDPKLVPDEDVVPLGIISFRVGFAAISSEEGEPVVASVASFATGPEEATGAKYRRKFRLGTDEDPRCESPATWKGKPFKKLKKLFQVSGVDFTGNLAEDLAHLKGAEYQALMRSFDAVGEDGKERTYTYAQAYYQAGSHVERVDEPI